MRISIAVTGIAAALFASACGEQGSPVGPQDSVTTAAFGQGVPAADALSFSGRFEGTQTVTPLTPPFASVQMSGTGNATMLGRFTIDLPHTVNFAIASAQGTATLVAANGDMIIASFTGQAQVGPIVSIVEQATITGGTGRFAEASGSFTIHRLFNPAAGTTSGSFEGTISAPGAR